MKHLPGQEEGIKRASMHTYTLLKEKVNLNIETLLLHIFPGQLREVKECMHTNH